MSQFDYVEIGTYGTYSEFRGGVLLPDEERGDIGHVKSGELEDVLQDIIDDLERQIASYKRRLELVKMYSADKILESASIIKWFPNRADKADAEIMGIWNQVEDK